MQGVEMGSETKTECRDLARQLSVIILAQM